MNSSNQVYIRFWFEFGKKTKTKELIGIFLLLFYIYIFETILADLGYKRNQKSFTHSYVHIWESLDTTLGQGNSIKNSSPQKHNVEQVVSRCQLVVYWLISFPRFVKGFECKLCANVTQHGGGGGRQFFSLWMRFRGRKGGQTVLLWENVEL